MKFPFRPLALTLTAFTFAHLAGCVLKPTTDARRHFVLSTISTNGPAPAATQQISIAIDPIKMPSHLLRTSMSVRDGDNEIKYFENAEWAERLDQTFQRTLAVNLATLLPSDNIFCSIWPPDHATAKLSIDLQQFDVDTRGRGTLIAQWQISTLNSNKPLKNVRSQLVRTISPPRASPEVIAATLSELTSNFSGELATAIRETLGATAGSR
jgi:uncharacterized lipoprotein YmbA